MYIFITDGSRDAAFFSLLMYVLSTTTASNTPFTFDKCRCVYLITHRVFVGTCHFVPKTRFYSVKTTDGLPCKNLKLFKLLVSYISAQKRGGGVE